jgi:hypothetical protein
LSIPDSEFWRLIEHLSESPGAFPSGNPLSDEWYVSDLAAALAARARPDRAYIGVGREQNFTYIAAVRPRIAFIADIHRRNLYLQLLYKALFELSTDRADFMSRLFTKPRPAGLGTTITAAQLFDAYWHVSSSAADVYKKNLQDIKDVLTIGHRFPLSVDDVGGIEEVYYAFYWHGPSIAYQVGRRYVDLMVSVDQHADERSFLATEDAFAFVKTLHTRNLIVPVVADPAGSTALRGIADYLRQRRAVVSTFYVGGEPATLARTGRLPTFCANVAAMPTDRDSVFARPDLSGLNSTSATTEVTVMFATLRSSARDLALANRPADGWASRSVVPIAEELTRCQ